MITEEELKVKLRELRDSGKLPAKYGDTVTEMLEKKGISVTSAAVRKVASGAYVNLDIAEALIELAEENREEKLLKRLNRLLED